MAKATYLLGGVLAVVTEATEPASPWWQELAEKVQDELVGEVAALIVAAVLAVLALAQRKTIGRWWRDWREKRRHLRAQIKAERQRELLVASMRRVWVDGYLDSALDPSPAGPASSGSGRPSRPPSAGPGGQPHQRPGP